MADDFFVVGVPIEATKNGATPAAPAAGTLALYPKTDDLWYLQTSAGVETVLGGGGGSTQRTFALFMES